MADSANASPDYAHAAGPATTNAAPGRRRARRFAPRLWPTLAAALLIPLFISAGQWQWNKAASKAQARKQIDARRAEPALRLPPTLVDAQALRYRKVIASGHYETERQILIDNRIHRGRAGYHVLTPLRVDGSAIRLLVNRGWIPARAERSDLPEISTPTGRVEISGTAIVPSTRFFTLGGGETGSGWQRVWQNLDLSAYAQAANVALQPIVVELDAQSEGGAEGGGFVREWPAPDDRRATNLGYALQWWAFAATTAALWLVLNFRRPS